MNNMDKIYYSINYKLFSNNNETNRSENVQSGLTSVKYTVQVWPCKGFLGV